MILAMPLQHSFVVGAFVLARSKPTLSPQSLHEYSFVKPQI